MITAITFKTWNESFKTRPRPVCNLKNQMCLKIETTRSTFSTQSNHLKM